MLWTYIYMNISACIIALFLATSLVLTIIMVSPCCLHSFILKVWFPSFYFIVAGFKPILFWLSLFHSPPSPQIHAKNVLENCPSIIYYFLKTQLHLIDFWDCSNIIISQLDKFSVLTSINWIEGFGCEVCVTLNAINEKCSKVSAQSIQLVNQIQLNTEGLFNYFVITI